MQILAIDIGTSSVKAGVISRTGGLVAWGREGLSFSSQNERQAGLATQWLQAIARVTKRLSTMARFDAVAVSGNGPTIVPVDEAGATSGPVLMWSDRREERIDGNRSFFLPKIAWFKSSHPDAYEASRWLISCPEYVIYSLTNEAVTIDPTPEFTPYIWDTSSIGAYGIDSDKLPPFVPTGTRVGEITPAAADRFSLPTGLPVYAGGSDFLMCLLGTATTVPGRTCDRAGTSEGINHCSVNMVESSSLRTLPHLISGYYNVAGILASTGRIFEWFRRISGQQKKSYDKMLSEIAAVPAGTSGPMFLPSLHLGATWEFSGAAFIGLEPYHGITEMGRAVVDSIGFSIRGLIETLERHGCRVEELRVSGGQARNRIWNQMKANMTGRRIVVPEVIDAELLGNAAATFTGEGDYDTLSEAADDLYRPVRRFDPDDSQTESLNEEFSRFCETRGRIVEQLDGAGSDPSEADGSSKQRQ